MQASIASEGDAEVVALAIVNTVLGACGAGLTTLFLIKFLFGSKWSYLMTLNGSLTGMVSMCGGCNGYMPWAAILVGCLGGVCFVGWHFLMLRLQLDDPLDAVAVHGAGGFIGVLCQPIFTYESGIVYAISEYRQRMGLTHLHLYLHVIAIKHKYYRLRENKSNFCTNFALQHPMKHGGVWA